MKKSVLIIEDEPYLQSFLTALLADAGYTPLVVDGARMAMQKMRMQAFFCVITDIQLKEGSGEEVIDFIRGSRRADVPKDTPVIVVSGNVNKELLQKVAGKVNGIFVKPFKPEDLLKRLEQLGSETGSRV